MKKIIGGISLPFFMFFISTSQQLLSKVTFGSRDSALKISSGANLNVTSPNLVVDGTLVQEDVNAAIDGNIISFDNGVLEHSDIEVLMKAEYDPAGTDAVKLVGNGRFRAEPGTLIPALDVSNQGNRLEGQPLFNGPITFADGGTELTIAMQNMLNQSILLNGGQIKLDDHLHLADEVKLSGSGTIDLNKRQLSFGSFYSTSWDSTLLLKNALDIELNGNIDLLGTWTFSGICSLHGNGAKINLQNGGQFILDPNTTLYLDDVYVTGLGDSHGQFVLNNATSEIRSSNSTFRLYSDYLFDQGSFYVEGPSTFELAGNDFTFDIGGKLTVDGTTLWLDPLDTPCFPDAGHLNAPLPIYDGMVWNGPNVEFDIASGHLSLINRGSIKEVVDRSIAGESEEVCGLLDGSVTETINLNQCVCVGPFDFIKIDANVCINGNGTSIQFTNPNHPQLIVSAGKILTLKNVSLLRIAEKTIDLRQGARIHIDRGVLFELCENVTFSQGLIRLTPSCSDPAEDGYVFTMRGIGCRKKANVFPLVPTEIAFNPDTGQFETMLRKIFQLRVNTMQLDNIEFGGMAAVSHENSPDLSGAIALSCNTAVNLDVDHDMNFFVEGPNNEIVLQLDGLILSGNIAFGDMPDNTLHFKTALTSELDLTAPFREGVQVENPVVFIDGDPGIFVFSELGLAQLIFDPFTFTVRNTNINAFVVDDNSYLRYDHLEILDFPIKQSSPEFRFNGFQLSGLQIEPAFVRAQRELLRKAHIVPTAIYLKRQKEKQYFAHMQSAALHNQKMEAAKPRPSTVVGKPQHGHGKPASSKTSAKKKKRANKNKNKRDLDVEDFEEEELDKEIEKAISPTFPIGGTPADQTFVDQLLNADKAAVSGSIKLLHSTISNFTPGVGFNILLLDGSSLIQGTITPPTIPPITLDATRAVNIAGPSNVIFVRGSITINNGGLNFANDENLTVPQLNVNTSKPELTFQFINDDGAAQPVVIINTDLLLEPNVILRFAGRGTVILNNNRTIKFNGTAGSQRASLIITDNATMVLQQGENTSTTPVKGILTGIGRVEVSDRGRIHINQKNSRLIIGTDADKAPTPLNDFILDVHDSGEIRIESIFAENGTPSVPQSPATGASNPLTLPNPAKLSIWFTTLACSIENDGLISIVEGGQLEINAEVNAGTKVLKQGTIAPSSFSVSRDGELYVDARGKLVLAPNTGSNGGAAFTWKGKQGACTGCGFVEYFHADGSIRNFIGRLKALPQNEKLFSSSIQFTMEELARNLVQEVPALQVSTVFIGTNGKRFLRTSNGTLVELRSGDTIISDNLNTGEVQGIDASGNAFSYTINGVRR